MPGRLFQNKEINQIVEHHLSQWVLSRNIKDKSEMQARLASGVRIDYITISREVGSGGVEVARILSDLMKWQLFDKEILDYMAENMKVHVRALESVDERSMGWIEDWLKPVFASKSNKHVEQLSYYKHLGKVLLVIAKHAHAIIVGRAAGILLPRDKGLSVRVTAPFELRCQRYAKENQISIEEATSRVKKADKTQSRFVKDFLEKDVSDPKYYDIVCNTEKITPGSVAKLIWRSFDQRIASQKEHAKIKVEGVDIARVVEYQMQQWEQSRSKDKREKHAYLADGGEIDYITISRELGSGGKEIARMLADLLKWQLFDKEILDYMAENMDVHVSALESIDERAKGWFKNKLASLYAGKSGKRVEPSSYHKHLAEMLLVIAAHGRAIIVGRGASQTLPREKGLSVRVTAPFEMRCKRYATINNIGIEKARSFVENADKEQSRFVKNFSGKDISDSKYYDVVCSTEKLSPVSVAKLISRALDQRAASEAEQAEGTKD